MSRSLPDLQKQFDEGLSKIARFRHFPVRDCLIELSRVSIELSPRDVNVLLNGLERSAGHLEMVNDRDRVKLERRIAELARELAESLGHADDGSGWRHVWNENVLDIEASVELDDLRSSLEIMAESATQYVESVGAFQAISMGPRSNRGDPCRYFYWMTLLAFWRYYKGRSIKPANGARDEPHGPIVDLIQVMSGGALDERSRSGEAIRSFVRSHESKVRTFAEGFIPRWQIVLGSPVAAGG